MGDSGKPDIGEGLADLPPEALELDAANTEVEAWLKKHAAPQSANEIELGADLNSLLITAEREVEDYLIDKNLK